MSVSNQDRQKKSLVAPFFGYFVIALIYAPIIWLVVMSISEEPLSGIPGSFTGDWYEKLFESRRWRKPIILSVEIAVVVGLLCAIFATLLGRVLPRLRRRGLILGVHLLPLFVPSVVMGTALFLYLRSFLGLKLGVWSLVIGHFVWAFPFSLLAVVVMASRFDRRLVDAAADIGANSWRRFWDIELPSLRPGIIAAGLFGFLLSFNELSFSIFLRGRTTTLSLFAWAQTSSHSSNVPLIFALNSLVLSVSIIIIFGAFWYLFVRSRN